MFRHLILLLLSISVATPSWSAPDEKISARPVKLVAEKSDGGTTYHEYEGPLDEQSLQGLLQELPIKATAEEIRILIQKGDLQFSVHAPGPTGLEEARKIFNSVVDVVTHQVGTDGGSRVTLHDNYPAQLDEIGKAAELALSQANSEIGTTDVKVADAEAKPVEKTFLKRLVPVDSKHLGFGVCMAIYKYTLGCMTWGQQIDDPLRAHTLTVLDAAFTFGFFTFLESYDAFVAGLDRNRKQKKGLLLNKFYKLFLRKPEYADFAAEVTRRQFFGSGLIAAALCVVRGPLLLPVILRDASEIMLGTTPGALFNFSRNKNFDDPVTRRWTTANMFLVLSPLPILALSNFELPHGGEISWAALTGSYLSGALAIKAYRKEFIRFTNWQERVLDRFISAIKAVPTGIIKSCQKLLTRSK